MCFSSYCVFIRTRQYFLQTYRAKNGMKKIKRQSGLTGFDVSFGLASSVYPLNSTATEFRCKAVKKNLFPIVIRGLFFQMDIWYTPHGTGCQALFTALHLLKKVMSYRETTTGWRSSESPPPPREAFTVPVAVPPAAAGIVSQSERLPVMNQTDTELTLALSANTAN